MRSMFSQNDRSGADPRGVALLRVALGLSLSAAPLGCSERPTPPEPPAFVRGGFIVPAGSAEGREISGDRVFVARAHRPGEALSWSGPGGSGSATVPQELDCGDIFTLDLGDLQAAVARGAAAPDTALAFSPDGGRLAVGTTLGELWVLDGFTGAVLARRRLAETLVKSVRWSADGSTLYSIEQSPEAHLRALDPADLSDRWALRLADRVGESAAPAGEDIFGVYSLPTAYGLHVARDGSLLLAAAHGWSEGGARQNRSQVLRVSPEGQIVDQWPPEPISATLLNPAVDPGGAAQLVVASRSADGPAPAAPPLPSVLRLDAAPLALASAIQAPALGPWFKQSDVWQAIDIDLAQDRLALGYADGRVHLRDAAGAMVAELSPGAPVLAGEVPIAASVGALKLLPGQLIFTTSYTQIPFGASAPELRPTSVHEADNTLWSVNLDGSTRWRWQGGHRLEAIASQPGGPLLAVAAGERTADDRRDLYGVLVFNLSDPSHPDLAQRCPTEGPVTFAPAWAPDGRLAFVEHPWRATTGEVGGAYRLRVTR